MSVLTKTMEDYLEAVWIIALKKNVVRVKDLMDYFTAKVSTINNAIKVLAREELVSHEKYGHVELTRKGEKLARRLYERHMNISRFLTEVLNTPEKIAIEEACHIEHYLGKNSYENLLKLQDFLAKPSDGKSGLESFQQFLDAVSKNSAAAGVFVSLDRLKENDRGTVKKIIGNAELRGRLLAMGLITNASFEVVRMAPLGDPVTIKIKNYFLSIRKDEAEAVMVSVGDIPAPSTDEDTSPV